jgi:prolyl-tRNA synthetase
MTHGDDEGLRLPPAIAPKQIVIVPILRDKPEDAEVLAYCEALAKDLAAGVTLAAPSTRSPAARPTSGGTGCGGGRR